MQLIFEQSSLGRTAKTQIPRVTSKNHDLPDTVLRHSKLHLPEVSELQVVRHYTKLSQKNFSIDSHFYPLGSCTMKYNPRAVHRLAMLPDFLSRHPLAIAESSQGYLSCIHHLQEILKEVTGMKGISLTPMAGAQENLLE